MSKQTPAKADKVARNRQAADEAKAGIARDRRRRRGGWITVTAVVLLLIAGLIGFLVYQSHRKPAIAVPTGTTNDGGTNAGLFVTGDGPVTVEVYLDFLCPHCKDFETAVTPTLNQLVTDHKIKLVWHPLNFLDPDTTTKYSTRAANAAGCAADAPDNKLKAYGEALFANQPAEGSAGLTDDQLIDIGGPVGLNAPEFAQCVRGQRYDAWVNQLTGQAIQRGVNATPTVYVNGQVVANPTAANVTAAVNAAS